MHSAQSASDIGCVPNAALNQGTCTTSTWRANDNPIAPNSRGLVNNPRNADTWSDRELKQLNSWASTSTVNAAVRASTMVPEPGSRPPGSLRSRVTSVAMAMTRPTNSTPSHISRSITRSVGLRGGRSITSGGGGSYPRASAGVESVSRLIHRIWVASSGAITASPPRSRPSSPAPTTPRNMVRTSPALDDSR